MSEETPGRIAGELKKLHEAGAIKDHADAAFYARFLVMFGAEYVPIPTRREQEGRK